MAWPLASRTITVAPGSPVPLTVVPCESIWAVGSGMGPVSIASSWVVGETLPAASVWVTTSTPPPV